MSTFATLRPAGRGSAVGVAGPDTPWSNLAPDAARLAALLAERGTVTAQELQVALDHSEHERASLADALIELGFATEEAVYAALAEATGMELVDLTTIVPSSLALRLVPERVARKHRALPLTEDNRVLTYAISRPYQDEAERDLAFASGRRPRAVLARPSDLLAAIDRHYESFGDLELLLAKVRSEARIEVEDRHDGTPQSPVIDLCNHVVARAVEGGASDIHIEPGKSGMVVRFRLGGILGTVMTIPAEASAAVRNRFKVMGQVDISVKARPQDGAFRLKINERAIDIRLSTLPTINGEKIVLRVIDSRNEPKGIEALGYDAPSTEALRQALDRPDGLVLVTGPTGSGKSTTLYSGLHHLRNGRTNIVSVEDPVERVVEGVNQIPVNAKGGNGFAAILRSVLRQDPNVIMVGEIRDAEVAQIVGQAAYTGHLVLTSLHTTDAISAITRLLNLGLEPFKVAESLTAIVAQRLVRRLCPACRKRNDPGEALAQGRSAGIRTVPMTTGAGCERCRFTGYIDRLPVMEVLVPDDHLRTAIARGATGPELRTMLHAAGFRSMRDYGLELVTQGITSLEEINRVLAADHQAPQAATAAAAPARPEPASEPAARSNRRVLVVDDDRVTRMLVRLLLEKEGYEVVEGENGTQAIELAMREKPNLLVIDLLMPQMDGYEAIAHIRRQPLLATLPVMVLTSEAGTAVEQRVLELGADDYLAKPFEPALLIARIRASFRRYEHLAA
ncbi:MAG: ATPase, T2SS/T4P/T4SS family [Vicinamibacterales bacterium]